MSEMRAQLRLLDKEQRIDIIVELRGLMAKQAARIQAIEDRVAKHSSNSSKPASSDGLKKPGSVREKGKHKSGGQKGHPGKRLEMVSHPHHIHLHEGIRGPQCQADLGAGAVPGIEKGQVFDVPPIAMEVTEHQAQITCCPQCQVAVQAALPAGIDQGVQYGNRLKAQAVYLNSYQLLPLARVCEVFGDFYGHTPSAALVLNATEALPAQLD